MQWQAITVDSRAPLGAPPRTEGNPSPAFNPEDMQEL
jgi:hypothetical protein